MYKFYRRLFGGNGTFGNHKIYVLNLCSHSQSSVFTSPAEALRKKGFGVIEHRTLPSIADFRKTLKECRQFWLISDYISHINSDEYFRIAEHFFNQGHGVYIWGDNDPYYADANKLSLKLFNLKMSGNTWGDNVITLCKPEEKKGIIPGHLITTGIVNLYEGHTIATVETNSSVKPLIYGSAGNVVAAYYDNRGRRAIIDGGFTRLYIKWDTAGTDRYITNAAAWLTNIERFGL